MSLLNKIKEDVKKAGQNRGKFIYFRPDEKVRIRFLQDMDEGIEIVFHDNFQMGINVPCQETFGKSCPYCEDEDLRTRSQYIWSVYNYDSNEVQLLMFPVNNTTPLPAIVAYYENYGTLVDRDYVLTSTGKGMARTFTVIPMDKVKFRNKKAKPYSQEAVHKMIAKAYPAYGGNDEEDDIPEKSTPSQDSSWDDDDDDMEVTYENLSPRELYDMCKERDIDVPQKKSAKFYILQLEEYDKAQEDWGDEDDEYEDDEWDE